MIRKAHEVAALFASALSALVYAGVSEAWPGDPPRTRTVAYDDLDLSGVAGARVLHHRIELAAHEVCAPLEGRTPRERALWGRCVAEAIEGAVFRVNSPVLTELHESRGRAASIATASR